MSQPGVMANTGIKRGWTHRAGAEPPMEMQGSPEGHFSGCPALCHHGGELWVAGHGFS